MQKCHYMRVVTIRNPLHGGQTFLVVQEDDHDHKYGGYSNKMLYHILEICIKDWWWDFFYFLFFLGLFGELLNFHLYQ